MRSMSIASNSRSSLSRSPASTPWPCAAGLDGEDGDALCPERQILLHLPIGRSDDRHVRPLHYRPARRASPPSSGARVVRCFQRLDGDPSRVRLTSVSKLAPFSVCATRRRQSAAVWRGKSSNWLDLAMWLLLHQPRAKGKVTTSGRGTFATKSGKSDKAIPPRLHPVRVQSGVMVLGEIEQCPSASSALPFSPRRR